MKQHENLVRAFTASPSIVCELRKLEQFLGKNCVDVIDTSDSFYLNAVVDGAHLITHKLTEHQLQSNK